MSTQKDTKTPNQKGEKSGNITAYSKSKLSNKPICRKTIKPIKQQLKVNGKTIEESLLDLPRFTLYFILHGKVIQEYLNLFAINSGCAPLTVDDVRKVIADNRLGEQIDIEKYDKYDIANKGCNIDGYSSWNLTTFTDLDWKKYKQNGETTTMRSLFARIFFLLLQFFYCACDHLFKLVG